MSPVREKFIKIIQSLPYEIDKEILKRNTKEILQEITQKYVDTYGVSDLSQNDKDCIQSLSFWDKSLTPYVSTYF